LDCSGIFAALTTPFAPDGSVSCTDLAHNIGLYNATDLAGYVVLGSTGEAVLLTAAETDAVLATAIAATAKDKKLIAGTGAESTAETIERTKRAAALGYSAAMVRTPHYYKPSYTPEVLISHYQRIADESPIPILLYSIPQFTGVALEAPEVSVLAAHKNIIGIKDSSGNVPRISEMVRTAPASCQVITGSGSALQPSLAAGAKGAILGLACALAESFVAIYECFHSGQVDKSRDLQRTLLEASAAIEQMAIPGFKYAMDCRGYRGGRPRPPLQPLSAEQKRRVDAVLYALEATAIVARS
jgi:4-hydroxy-2-oxoglutarate aldolase